MHSKNFLFIDRCSLVGVVLQIRIRPPSISSDDESVKRVSLEINLTPGNGDLSKNLAGCQQESFDNDTRYSFISPQLIAFCSCPSLPCMLENVWVNLCKFVWHTVTPLILSGNAE